MRFLSVLVVLILLSPLSVSANQEILASFPETSSLSATELKVPTVVGVNLPFSNWGDEDYTVLEVPTGKVLPVYVEQFYNDPNINLSATTDDRDLMMLVNNNYQDYVDFYHSSGAEAGVVITVTSPTPISVNQLNLVLGAGMEADPRIMLQAEVKGELIYLIQPDNNYNATTDFPTVTSDSFIITIKHKNTLRLSEVVFDGPSFEQPAFAQVRFLAQPGMTYNLYRSTRGGVGYTETNQSLVNAKAKIILLANSFVSNPGYIPADADKDGIADENDNCPSVANIDQADIDASGQGDVCEDFDLDGYQNSKDNCPDLPNRDQSDNDGDGIGDECDAEESRFTEKHAWIPWAGMGIAVMVILTLFVLVGREKRRPE